VLVGFGGVVRKADAWVSSILGWLRPSVRRPRLPAAGAMSAMVGRSWGLSGLVVVYAGALGLMSEVAAQRGAAAMIGR
jgi:hypothetical protein